MRVISICKRKCFHILFTGRTDLLSIFSLPFRRARTLLVSVKSPHDIMVRCTHDLPRRLRSTKQSHRGESVGGKCISRSSFSGIQLASRPSNHPIHMQEMGTTYSLVPNRYVIAYNTLLLAHSADRSREEKPAMQCALITLSQPSSSGSRLRQPDPSRTCHLLLCLGESMRRGA